MSDPSHFCNAVGYNIEIIDLHTTLQAEHPAVDEVVIEDEAGPEVALEAVVALEVVRPRLRKAKSKVFRNFG